MRLHVRNSTFLYHTNKKMTHELEHIVWAGARWGRGKNAKHQTAMGVLLYFSVKVKRDNLVL